MDKLFLDVNKLSLKFNKYFVENTVVTYESQILL